MPNFKYKTIREMAPKPGVKFATRYYKQTASEYTRLSNFVTDTTELIVDAANQAGMFNELDQPLENFRRTNNQTPYSTLDILTDLMTQLEKNKDAPEAMIGRWNRALPPQFEIVMQEDVPPNPVFNRLFYR